MKRTRRLIFVLLAAMAALCSTPSQAAEFCIDNGGCGYDECCRTSSLAPAIALGTIALVAIIAVALQNTSGHSHCHSHN
jgi:hypothetical protein